MYQPGAASYGFFRQIRRVEPGRRQALQRVFPATRAVASMRLRMNKSSHANKCETYQRNPVTISLACVFAPQIQN